jgi:hypothetical protein
MDLIQVKQKEDDFIKELTSNEVRSPFQLREGILFYGDPPVLAQPSSLQQMAARLLHDHPTAGHLGRDMATKKVKNIY